MADKEIEYGLKYQIKGFFTISKGIHWIIML